MLKTMLYIFLSLNLFVVRGQINFYSDHFKGGVTGGGVNTFNLSGQIDLMIPTGATIRKAYLFASATKHVNFTDFPSEKTIFINNQSVVLSMNDALDNMYSLDIIGSGPPLYKTKTIVKDISNYNLTSVITLNLPPQPLPPYYWEFYILVLYEDNALPLTAVDVFINNQDIDSVLNYYVNTSLFPDLNNPVGLALNASHICDTIQDGSFVFVNSNLIGLIGGNDYNTFLTCGGTNSGFHYGNNLLSGLGDDTPNEIVSGSDALANIVNFSNSNNFNITFEYQSDRGPKSNAINQLFLSYTSPCDEFPTQTSTDTTLCQGSTAQLFASGGQAYEWQPATGLSCTDCPNPIVTADSSRLYTVRIWNNDSCSVVRPIKVNVQPLPQFSGVGSTPTACGQNTGSAIAVAQNTTPLPISYSINGAPFAFSSTYTGNFTNLSAGANTIILRDAFGCETDTVIQIGLTNTTNAFFTATPNSGAAPLSVSFTNKSTNATNYNWFIESDFVGENLLQHTFDTSGSYTVTLIAWQIDPLCADTFSIQIVVYDSLIIQIPNVFTPNGDGINDQFTITTNQPVSVEYHLFNRWGNVIAQDTKPTTVGNSNFVLPIWDGAGYSDGTYFYVIRVVHDGKEYEFDGFLERIE